jgi:putative ABC transport system permease protein
MRLSLLQDMKYAARSLRRAPSFAAAAVLTLTLGIGAATAAFALVDALVLRELSAPEPHRLVKISTTSTPDGGVPFAVFRELRSEVTAFADVVGTWGLAILNVEARGTYSPGSIVAATESLFDVLGVRAAAGRLFSASEVNLATLAPEAVAVLGHDFWQRQFGGEISAIGATIRIDGVPFVVVGVVPDGFTGFWQVAEPDVIIPLTARPLLSRQAPSVLAARPSRTEVVARLHADRTLQHARAHLAARWRDLTASTVPAGLTPRERESYMAPPVITSAARGFPLSLRDRFQTPLFVVLSLTILLALVGTVGLVGLMLSRAAALDRDTATRIALGMSRRRLLQYGLVEAALITVPGAVGGLLFAQWSANRLAVVLLSDTFRPTVLDVRLDAPVLAFALGLAGVTVLLVGTIPMLRALRAVDTRHAHLHAATAARRPLSRAIVGAQIALSVTLLAGAGLLVRSGSELSSFPLGFESDDVIVAEMFPRGAYGDVDHDSYIRNLLDRVTGVPGVVAASTSRRIPGSRAGFRELVSAADSGAEAAALSNAVSPGFFDALRIAVRHGRDFEWTDSASSGRVAIVSESLARRLFGTAQSVGRHVRIGGAAAGSEREIVGVVADARLVDVRDSDVLTVYVPVLQNGTLSYNSLIVQGSNVSPAALNRAVEGLGVEYLIRTRTLNDIRGRAVIAERLSAALSSFFGALALLIAVVGLYGHVAYMVNRRTREIGIRIALGAESRRIVALVGGEALLIAAIGVVIGLAGSMVLGRLVQQFLFGVRPDDPVSLVGAPLVLLTAAVLASVPPAWRAARTSPANALRAE